jgi:hypothetical protein
VAGGKCESKWGLVAHSLLPEACSYKQKTH